MKSNITAIYLLLREHLKEEKTYHVVALLWLTSILGSVFTHFPLSMEQTLCIHDILVELWLLISFLFTYAFKDNMQMSKIPQKYICLWWPTWPCFFFFFLLLSSKVKVDAINDLQYCVAKTTTKSDLFVKYKHYI